jgi:hypothetical protein
MRREVRWNSALTLLAAGLVLGSCAAGANSPASSLSPASDHGAVGARFKASFPAPVKETTYVDSGKRQPQYGVGILRSAEYTSGSGAPPTVNVSVETLTNTVPPRRARAFLRSYLPGTHGGRIIDYRGHLAAIEIVPGCNPSGQCVGEVGTLALLDGTTVFSVWTAQANAKTANGELHTLVLVGP